MCYFFEIPESGGFFASLRSGWPVDIVSLALNCTQTFLLPDNATLKAHSVVFERHCSQLSREILFGDALLISCQVPTCH